MNEVSAEQTILDEGGVKITNLRAIVGPKTYTISHITSVSMGRLDPSTSSMLVLMVGGAAVTFFCIAILIIFDPTFGMGWLGVLGGISTAAFGFLLFRSSKPSYIVRIGSASGETNVLSSPDEAQIRRIVTALNDAIVRKG